MTNNVILVGGPDTGKTNFLARLIAEMQDGKGSLTAVRLPEDIRYIEEALAHLTRGEFAPRSHNSTEELSGEIIVEVRSITSGGAAQISIPDVAGETWDEIAKSGQISQEWLDRVRAANGALLFVRVLSELNVSPMDWVNDQELLPKIGANQEPEYLIPTQVMLCELVRLLEGNLRQPEEGRARVAIVVTAWDRLDPVRQAAGPKAFIEKEFPLFAGRLANAESVEIGIFAASVVGGELNDARFRSQFLKGDIIKSGFVLDGTVRPVAKLLDFARPVAWTLRLTA